LETSGRRCRHVRRVSNACHKSKRPAPRTWIPIVQGSVKRVIFRVTCSKVRWKRLERGMPYTTPPGPRRDSMRGIISSSLIPASLFAGSFAWAAARDDDKDARQARRAEPRLKRKRPRRPYSRPILGQPRPPAARQEEEDQNQGKKPSPLYFESGDIWHSGCKFRNGRCEWSRTLQKIANG
jgi:hypothetical protein